MYIQGVIQDFEVEGRNEKSNQKMLLKKGKLLFQYPAMDTPVIIERGGIGARGVSPLSPPLYDTLILFHFFLFFCCSWDLDIELAIV